MDLSFQPNTGLWNAHLNCIFKFGTLLTSNCFLDINFEASVVILILRTVNASFKLYIIFVCKNAFTSRENILQICM